MSNFKWPVITREDIDKAFLEFENDLDELKQGNRRSTGFLELINGVFVVEPLSYYFDTSSSKR